MTWKTLAATMAKTIQKCALSHVCSTWAVLPAESLVPRNVQFVCIRNRNLRPIHNNCS